jgi:predicted dehydrogenase
MLAETRPDVVIVTTIDSFHDDYICRPWRLDALVTEKPMTTDENKCRRILETQKKPAVPAVAPSTTATLHRAHRLKICCSPESLAVLSVIFTGCWTPSRADYFRRWHSYKNIQGAHGPQSHPSF